MPYLMGWWYAIQLLQCTYTLSTRDVHRRHLCYSFYGINIAQAYVYFRSNRSDPTWTKWLAGFVMCVRLFSRSLHVRLNGDIADLIQFIPLYSYSKWYSTSIIRNNYGGEFHEKHFNANWAQCRSSRKDSYGALFHYLNSRTSLQPDWHNLR